MAKISEITLLQQSETYALVVEVQTNMQGIAKAIGKGFMDIKSLFDNQNVLTTDMPFVEYPHFESMTENDIKMIIGFKSSHIIQGKENIQSIIIPERKIISCLHRGNYMELSSIYCEMMEWINMNGYKASGTSVEYYYSKPDTKEDDIVTRVEMPLL